MLPLEGENRDGHDEHAHRRGDFGAHRALHQASECARAPGGCQPASARCRDCAAASTTLRHRRVRSSSPPTARLTSTRWAAARTWTPRPGSPRRRRPASTRRALPCSATRAASLDDVGGRIGDLQGDVRRGVEGTPEAEVVPHRIRAPPCAPAGRPRPRTPPRRPGRAAPRPRPQRLRLSRRGLGALPH